MSRSSTVAAWVGGFGTIAVAIVATVGTCVTSWDAAHQRVADNLPAFIIQVLDPAAPGLSLLNAGKGPAKLRVIGFFFNEVAYGVGDAESLPEEQQYYLAPQALISFGADSFDAFAKKYLRKETAKFSDFVAQEAKPIDSQGNHSRVVVGGWIEYGDVVDEETRHAQTFLFQADRTESGIKYAVIPGTYCRLEKGDKMPPARLLVPKGMKQAPGGENAESSTGSQAQDNEQGSNVSNVNTVTGSPPWDR